jgi:hypothetical protein
METPFQSNEVLALVAHLRVAGGLDRLIGIRSFRYRRSSQVCIT